MTAKKSAEIVRLPIRPPTELELADTLGSVAQTLRKAIEALEQIKQRLVDEDPWSERE